jgi:hypothetical protein
LLYAAIADIMNQKDPNTNNIIANGTLICHQDITVIDQRPTLPFGAGLSIRSYTIPNMQNVSEIIAIANIIV